MINKADDREARARFVNHSYDHRWPKQTIHSSWSFIDLLPKSLPQTDWKIEYFPEMNHIVENKWHWALFFLLLSLQLYIEIFLDDFPVRN